MAPDRHGQTLRAQQLLTALRSGPFGAESLNAAIDSHWRRANGAAHDSLPSLITRYQGAARCLREHLHDWLPAATQAEWQAATHKLVQAGVAGELAANLTALEYTFAVLDLVDLAQQAGVELQTAAKTWFDVDARLTLGAWRSQINRLPTDTLWQTQARASARDDVYSTASQITHSLLARQINPETWSAQHRSTIDRLHRMLSTLATQAADLAPVSVALRELRHLA